jgi:hypothetical protein
LAEALNRHSQNRRRRRNNSLPPSPPDPPRRQNHLCQPTTPRNTNRRNRNRRQNQQRLQEAVRQMGLKGSDPLAMANAVDRNQHPPNSPLPTENRRRQNCRRQGNNLFQPPAAQGYPYIIFQTTK